MVYLFFTYLCNVRTVELIRIYIFERFVRAPARACLTLDRSRRSKSSFTRLFGQSLDSRIDRFRFKDSENQSIIFFSQNPFLEKFLSRKMSFSQNFFLAKCPSRKISSFFKSLSQKFLLVREGFSLLYVRWEGV